MNNESPTIATDEVLARFVISKRWVRNDGTLKPNAFIPSDLGLSVTRHKGFCESELWQTGFAVAIQRGKMLFGRADFKCGTATRLSLSVRLNALPDNPNHVTISDWPQEKSEQKILAMEIAANATFLAKP